MDIIFVDKPSYLPQDMVSQLQCLGTFVAYTDIPDPATVASRLAEADIAIVEWSVITREMLEAAPKLKHIVLVTTGFSRIDISAARDGGISVSNAPGYSRQSVAEHVLGLFLAMAKSIVIGSSIGRRPGASYLDQKVGTELNGAALGVLGVGSIGSWVCKLGLGLGMQVSGYSRSRILVPDVEQLELRNVVSRSNFLAACLPESDETKGLLSAELIGLMPKGSFFVTIGGNQCFDEAAALGALNDGILSGLGLDERPENEELASHERVLITPGSAWYTVQALDRNAQLVIDAVRACVNGHPINVVNP